MIDPHRAARAATAALFIFVLFLATACTVSAREPGFRERDQNRHTTITTGMLP